MAYICKDSRCEPNACLAFVLAPTLQIYAIVFYFLALVILEGWFLPCVFDKSR